MSDACKAAGKLPDIGSTETGSSIGDVANAGRIWVFMIPRQPESIDLTKVDKARLVKGKYLNMTVSVNDELDKYDNNISTWMAQSKEERESKVARNFLGNGRVLWTDGQIMVGGKPKEITSTGGDASTENLPF